MAGLSIAETLNAQIRGMNQAVRNVNDGVSALRVAEGALNEMTNILQSIRELAVQAANGTLSTSERAAINAQVAGLLSEFDRISKSTEFNGLQLLNGEFGARSLQVGPYSANQIDIEVGDLRKEMVFEKTVGSGVFSGVQTLSVAGMTPYAVTAADVNNDGNLDLVAGGDPNHFVVYLGNGNGTFGAGRSFSTGIFAYTIAVEDVNGDGILDVLAAAQDPSINVHLGNGDGTFKPRVSYATGSTPAAALDSMSLGDLNGDGFIDIASTAFNDSRLDVLLGNGDGTFKARVSYATGVSPTGVSLVDMNRDGRLDAVVGFMGGGVDVLMGVGDGTLQARVSYSGAVFQSLTTGDLNGDGVPDVVGGDGWVNGVYVRLGNADGSLQGETGYAGLDTVLGVTLGDVNTDGILDILSAPVSGGVQFYLGNGDGTFKPPKSISMSGPAHVIGADLTNDGVVELIATDISSSTVAVFNPVTNDATAVADLNLTTAEKARTALAIIDRALTNLSSGRAALGSTQGRLEHTIESLFSSRETLSAAWSTIVDADIAIETTELVRNQILQQAGIAMLAQANLIHAQVVDLLRD